MTAQRRITVGIPVYNGEHFLAETVDSLLNQTVEDFDLIISDNASTDGTVEMGRRYAAQDGRVRFVRNEVNIGAYANCNKVIRLCRTEYFKLAMADDVCHPTLLARSQEILDSHPEAVATYAQAQFIDEQGRFLEIFDPGWHLTSDIARDRLRKVIYSGHWVNLFYGLMRTTALQRTRLFPSYASGDYRLIGELALLGTFIEIPERLFFRRLHPAASSQNSGLDWASEFFKGRRGSIELPLWHLCVDHATTILRSNLTTAHKLSSLGMVLDRMIKCRWDLLGDLRGAAAFLVSQASPLARRYPDNRC